MRLYGRYLAYCGRHPRSRKIFVIGTARSGTNWIGQILDSHPAMSATIEEPSILRLVVEMATNPPARTRNMPKLIRRYRREHAKVAPLNYVDKSHPNIWLFEYLLEAFPNALFVGIRRNSYATVNSMLQHGGVRRWCEIWQQLPLPNPFLGIEDGQADWYASLSITSRCALRWLSHSRRMDVLRDKYPDSLIVVDYEDLFGATPRILSDLQAFLSLADPFVLPQIRNASMSKWRTHLTPTDVDEIARITGMPVPDSE